LGQLDNPPRRADSPSHGASFALDRNRGRRPIGAKALARLLRARAFEARTYTSAREFLSALHEGLPECLIVDLQMPDMTGLELQRHLIRSGLRIPTIVITAHNEAGARERCESAGAAAFLSKPLQDISLLAAIESATGSAKT
jgi:FixJ family two-component response regulator